MLMCESDHDYMCDDDRSQCFFQAEYPNKVLPKSVRACLGNVEQVFAALLLWHATIIIPQTIYNHFI